ncbi:hypothetical protein BEI02_18525 [Elizabethkingia sp. HvH-WGS333]|uniref:hypothetical protein n=1 Tax=Elizabethkingia TaxID=308865 RepID=UPI000741770B|nr:MULTISPECIES: hypothetical protein [Elizabethkingia]KUG13309.1 hypothetical protein AMC91_03195 [Elizabethkingia miricola]MCL1657108.1 hypothetical protein [Elizabethkingia miricola]OIK45124.1 hypothetical protein BEI02_18525 [Elizabethkingia sp. HvH-WGS333]
MIRIDKTLVDRLRMPFLDLVKGYFNYQIFSFDEKGNKVDKDKLIKTFKRKRSLEFKMLRFFHANLERIILVEPNDMMDLNKEFLDTINFRDGDSVHETEFDRYKKKMEGYYNSFFQVKLDCNGGKISYGRWLTKKLNVKVCPYCNHNYTFTINDNNQKVYSRPQFDHFYPKKKFPLFALSLYNLIPACAVCNSIKREHEISFHPYRDDCSETVTFSIVSDEGDKVKDASKWITDTSKLKIDFDHSFDGINVTDKTDNTNFVKRLGINKVLEEHTDYVEEIVSKIYAYNKDYYIALCNDFNGLGKTPEQINTIIWNAYLDDNGKRPMSKLTTDVLKQFELI